MSVLIQVRLPEEQVKMLDANVKTGRFASRSEAIRDALRNQFWGVGVLPSKGSSNDVHVTRQKLSKQKWTAKKLNNV